MNPYLLTIVFLLNSGSADLTTEEIKSAYQKSYNYEKINAYEEAVKSLMIVYNVYSEGYTVNLRLGWLYYENKKYANSLYHYEKAMKTSPYSTEARLGYILPLLSMQKYDLAERIAYRILNVDYYNYYANLRLADALKKQGKFDLAEKVVNKMLTLYPTDIQFLTISSQINFALGKKAKTKKICSDIIILAPENYTAKSMLRQILRESLPKASRIP